MWALERLKAMHGLNDAPLAFQVAMQIFMTETLGELKAIATSYVDGNNNASSNEWLNKSHSKLSDRFGGAARQQPPMNHVGVKHELTDFGIRVSQEEFCQNLQPIPLGKIRAAQGDSPLATTELKAFRGLLGGLLWL
eukprot:818883-Pyramimonas_sp.AAC.1